MKVSILIYDRVLLFVSCVLACLLAAGCTDDVLPGNNDEMYPDVEVAGDKIILRGSINIASLQDVETRSLTSVFSLPDTHLYLVEFTDEGNPLVNTYIRTYEAEEETVVGDKVNFKLTLHATTHPRLLHLIALPKSETLHVKNGIEAAVIPELTTKDGVDAYWRRLCFPTGYCSEAGGGKWQPDPEMVAKLTEVQLIRNFAKISMTNEAAGFTLQGFEVINTAGKGSIAAWNSAARSFTEFIDGSGNMRNYSSLSEDYSGYLPADTPIVNQVGGPAVPSAFGLEDKYFYERPFSAEQRTFVIVKGIYKGNVNYYKLDIGKNDNNGIFQYYNLIRNFNFKINIKNVSASGYADAVSAASGSVFNNISFDVDLSFLTNMSDGKEVVYVNYTTKVLTSPVEETFNFRFTYKNLSDGKNNNNGYTLVGLEPGPVIQSVGSNKGVDGMRQVDMIIRPATEETKMQSFTVVKPSSGLGRTITLILHSKWTFNNLCAYPSYTKVWGDSVNVDKIRKGQGKEFTLFFDIPNSISESVFPLDIVIESKEQVVENQPGSGFMDVQSGESLYGGGQNKIQYHRHLTWTQYTSLNKALYENGEPDGIVIKTADGNEIHRVYCHFRTTMALTKGKQYEIKVHNENFEDRTIMLTAY